MQSGNETLHIIYYMRTHALTLAAAALLCATQAVAQTDGTWTLQDCLDYAIQNNIQIQKSQVQEQQGEVSLKQYKAQLLPTLSFSTNQSMGYRPFQESTAMVHDGQVTTTNNKLTYQGSYGLNASWTVWNGNINRMNIRQQELQNQATELGTEQNRLQVQEQIANLYIAILYTTEAEKVAEILAETAKTQWERGKELLLNGQMAQADVTALEAQYNAAKFDIVNSQTQIANYKRQLKALLELDITTPFDVSGTAPTDEQVMAAIPSATSVYEQALLTRPEIRSAQLSVDQADMQERIARAGYQPTVMLAASLGDNHYSASPNGVGEQMKTNLNGSIGLTVSVPILDQRRTKSNIEQAKLQRTTALLDVMDRRNTLSSTIEEYWLNAHNNQARYIAARSTVQSQQESYDQLNEQFKEGLKNIVDVMQGRDNLINAQQNLLQSKYNTLLYIQLLKFYSGATINM